MSWNNDPAEQFVEFPSDILTEDQFKELTAPRTLRAGQYRFKVAKVERIAPTDEKVGGDRVTLSVVFAPAGMSAPEGGWPTISRLFKQYLSPDERQRQSQYYDDRDKVGFIKACGIEYVPGTSLYLTLLKTVGCEVLANVTEREGSDGRTYTDVKGFRPVA